MIPSTKIRHAASAFAISLCALSAYNCSQDDSGSGTEAAFDSSKANVSLQLNYSSTPLVDSLVLDCTGADTLHYVTDPEKPYLEMNLFPHDNWVFSAKLYANGTLMQTGELTTKLEAGTNTSLSIQMHAIVGFIYGEISLGLGNPAGIQGGNLILNDGESTFTYPLEIAGSTAVFNSGILELGKTYSVQITLEDSTGTEIYRVEDSFTLDEDTPVPELQIKSLRSKVAIALNLADSVKVEVNASLPAEKRAPQVNDILISEFLVTPSSKDSLAFGFVELYNGSNDTLQLKNCSIGKTTDAKDGAGILNQALPPRQALVLALDTSEAVPAEYRNTDAIPAFLKSNSSTGASIVLACDGTVLDSLYYGKVDSLTHMTALSIGSTSTATSKSTQLDLTQWDNRENPDNWCLGTPTPGVLSFCE